MAFLCICLLSHFVFKSNCLSISLLDLVLDSGFRLNHDSVSEENIPWLLLDSRERCGLAT